VVPALDLICEYETWKQLILKCVEGLLTLAGQTLLLVILVRRDALLVDLLAVVLRRRVRLINIHVEPNLEILDLHLGRFQVFPQITLVLFQGVDIFFIVMILLLFRR
jgi:hypothetical protein